jgi:hypothetical protein
MGSSPNPNFALIPWVGNYVPIALKTNQRPGQPPNNEQCIVVDLDWSNANYFVGGITRAIVFDASQQSTPPKITQIACLWVDNSNCAYGIFIKFPDTNFVLQIPPYEPGRVYPVITNQLQFIVWIAQTGLLFNFIQNGTIDNNSSTVTNIIVCDSNIPPVVVPLFRKNQETFNFPHAIANGTFTLYNGPISPPVTLRSVYITQQNDAAGTAWNLTFNVNGVAIGIVNLIDSTAGVFNTLLDLKDLFIPASVINYTMAITAGVPNGVVNVTAVADMNTWG